MQVTAEGLGRKFGQEWIFKNFSGVFRPGEKYAITGNNGSGKSTLLKTLGGCQLPSAGTLKYTLGETAIGIDSIYRQVSIIAPYTVLPEELTPSELLGFMRKFRSFSLGNKELIEKIRLWPSRNKPIKYFSSGMKQRLQLGLGFYSDATLLLLDEPTSNLDRDNIDWYLSIVAQPMPQRLVFISSNQEEEYACCQQKIDIKAFK